MHRSFKTLTVLILAGFFFALWQGDLRGAAVEGEYGLYTTGRLLVAAPEMRDHRFYKSVILMVEHDNDGAVGFIINKPIAGGPMGALLGEFGIELNDGESLEKQVELFYGGPVSRASLFVVHSNDYQAEGTRRVSSQFSLTHSIEILNAIATGHGPDNILFVSGYAGWGPGQLETEMERGDWLLSPTSNDLIFGDQNAEKWERASQNAGLDL